MSKEKKKNDLLQPGDIIQNWKITKKIGSGNFGQVYQAVNCYDNEIVAIKVEPFNVKKSVSSHLNNYYII